jgi:NADP-dependent aldehyde dehydrogenase
VADELDALGDEFVALVCRETALPAARIQGERGRTSDQMRLFAKVLRRGDFYGARIDQALPERQPAPRPDLRQYRIGLGPVAVFGASNFPLAFSTAGGDTASALAAGCPVVFKAHSGHMATAERVADAILRAAEKTAMPAGVFNMIYGAGVGEALVKHPAIQAVGFTGSLKGGRALCDMAAARPQPIPVFAEMSSINPVIVLPQALAARAESVARDLSASVVQGCGQFCTNPGLVLGIRSPQFSAFVQQVAGLMADQPAQTMLNAGTLSSYGKGLQKLLAHPGIEHLVGRPQAGNQAQPQLFKAQVSLLLEGDEVLQEEVFGPTTVFVEVADQAQLSAALHKLHGQLTATIIGEPADFEQFGELTAVLEQKVGRILLNGYPTGVEVCDSMVHGGPYPATSDARGTSVGTLAIDRFLRPVCFQNYPDSLLPEALKNANPLGIQRLVDGQPTRDTL